MNKKKVLSFMTDIFVYLAASVLYGISVNVFAVPNNLVQGGITGTAMLINHALPVLPTGVLVLLLNIPLFVFGWKFIGGAFIAKSSIVTIFVSLSLDLVKFIPAYQGDTLLASLFGGLLSGIALALVFLRGATTGGTDILAKLIRLKFPNFSMGRIMLYFDILVILTAGLMYKNVDNALYSLIMIFVSTYCIDYFIFGSSHAKALLIVTNKSKEISEHIMETMGRGLTVIPVAGGYTGEDKKMLVCALRGSEVAQFKKIVSSIDEDAFTMVCDASEIIGRGFKSIQ